jgi:hypothetical protein
LDLARAGVNQPCQVAIEYDPNYLNSHLAQLASLKRLVRAMLIESRLAELQNRRSDAIRICVDALRLSQEINRGGVVVDKMISLALEGQICQHLADRAAAFTASEGKIVVQALESIDTREESMEAVWRQEQAFGHRAYGWRERIGAILAFRQRQTMAENIRLKVAIRARQRRQLLVDLARRIYEQEKGVRPSSLQELAPIYLKTIPLGVTLPKS